MPHAQVYIETLRVSECPVCFISYGVPESFYRARIEQGGEWFCPNGHGLHFVETVEQRLRKALVQAQELANRSAEGERQARAKLKEITSELKRLQRRAENGVCPFCHRTFKQVQAHIARKHSCFS